MLKNKNNWLLLGILLLGTWVRVYGLDFGLPFIYHDDEPIIVNYALAYGRGDLNPHFFNVPPLLSYILFLAYGILFVLGKVSGVFANVDDFAYLFINDPSVFYVVGRVLLGLLPGVCSVFFIYRLGEKVFGDVRIGILSAFILSVNFLHVRDSHYIYFDIILTLAVMIFFILLHELFERGRMRDYAAVGVLIGLTTAIKYFGPFLCFPAGIVVFYRLFKTGTVPADKAKRLMMLVSASVGTFFLLHPFAFIEFGEFMRTMGEFPAGTVPPFFHVKISLIGSAGMPLLIFAVIGMARAVIFKRKETFVLIFFVIFYLLLISFKSQPAARYVLPVVPVVILFAAYGVGSVSGMMVHGGPSKKYLMVILGFAIAIPSVYKVILLDDLFSKEDTRTVAYQWIKKNVPSGEIVAVDALSSAYPRLVKDKRQVKEIYGKDLDMTFEQPGGAMDYKTRMILKDPFYPEETYFVHYLRRTDSGAFHSIEPGIRPDMEDLLKNRVKYVVLSDITYTDDMSVFYRQLSKNAELIKIITPYKHGVKRKMSGDVVSTPSAPFSLRELSLRERPGPYLEIYRIRDQWVKK